MRKSTFAVRAAAAAAGSDVAGLWAAVRAAPGDSLPKLVLADYLEENGDATTGYALRWCVAHDRWPHHVGEGPRGWAWANGVTGNVPRPHRKGYQRAVLPQFFFVVRGRSAYYTRATTLPASWRFGSDVEAVQILGMILERLCRVIGLSPPGRPDAATDRPRG